MRFPLYIAKRYFVSKNSKNAINIINWLSFTITIVSAVVLFIILSGFDGLKEISLSHLSYFDPDLKLEVVEGKSIIFSEHQKKQLKNLNEIEAFSSVIEERVVLSYNEKSNPKAFIKGVDSFYTQIIDPFRVIGHGQWFNQGYNQAVIGNGIAYDLSLSISNFENPLKLIVPKPGTGQISSVNKAYNSVSVFCTGVYQINEDEDKKYVFTDIALARELLQYKTNEITSIEFSVNESADLESLKKKITQVFDQNITVKDKRQLNAELYKMLNTENVFAYLIATLIVIISLFNVIGSIIMMLLDKKNDLKTLYSIGASIKEIRRIFFVQGLIMTLLGGVIGLVIGGVIVLIQQQFGLLEMAPNFPYPVQFRFVNCIIVILTISILGILASKIASNRVSKKLLA